MPIGEVARLRFLAVRQRLLAGVSTVAVMPLFLAVQPYEKSSLTLALRVAPPIDIGKQNPHSSDVCWSGQLAVSCLQVASAQASGAAVRISRIH